MRMRPSFRLLEFSSHASVFPIRKSRSPPSSTQRLIPRSPLPNGIEPETSRLGDVQATLYRSNQSAFMLDVVQRGAFDSHWRAAKGGARLQQFQQKVKPRRREIR